MVKKCAARTGSGERCKFNAKEDSIYCGHHDKENSETDWDTPRSRQSEKPKRLVITDDSDRCKARTGSGGQCKFKAKKGSKFCGHHQDETEEARTVTPLRIMSDEERKKTSLRTRDTSPIKRREPKQTPRKKKPEKTKSDKITYHLFFLTTNKDGEWMQTIMRAKYLSRRDVDPHVIKEPVYDYLVRKYPDREFSIIDVVKTY